MQKPTIRFTRAVAVGNPRKFTQGDKEEQETVEACNCPIKKCHHLLKLFISAKKALSHERRRAKGQVLSTIASHSVLCWAHINLLDEYSFSDNKLKGSVEITIPKIIA